MSMGYRLGSAFSDKTNIFQKKLAGKNYFRFGFIRKTKNLGTNQTGLHLLSRIMRQLSRLLFLISTLVHVAKYPLLNPHQRG